MNAETPSRRWRTIIEEFERPEWLSGWPFTFLMTAFLMYAFRDALTGSLRFYLGKVGLSPLWFVPDLMAFVIFGLFINQTILRNRSLPAALFTVNVLISLGIGIAFMQLSPAIATTAAKAIIPLFVGMAFCGRTPTEHWFPRLFLYLLVVVSCVGILLSPHVAFPWIGAEIDTFGVKKVVGKLWWAEGAVRHGGFAGDSTMAAFMTFFPFLLIFRYLPKWLNIATMVLIYSALALTTSKTAIGLFWMFAIFYVVFYVFPMKKRYEILSRAALGSYIFVLAPAILIIALGGVDLTEISSSLYSLGDRINNSWQMPFVHLNNLFPAGVLLGCGVGCFSYPMGYSALANYTVPVDNFYLTTYLFLGFPFVLFMIAQFLSVRRVKEEGKLIMIVAVNIYTITVACYGPSFATIVVGYTFSDLFLRNSDRWRRRFKRGAAAAPPQVVPEMKNSERVLEHM